MPLAIQCPNPSCGKTAKAPAEFEGRSVRCKHCGQKFVANQTIDFGAHDTRPKTEAATDPFAQLPAEFGRYRVLKLLGRGGMGAVFLAEDTHLGRKVALKLPSVNAAESPQRAERFVREARSAAILQHPNICTVYDAGQIGDRPYITMAYIDGRPLDARMVPNEPMPQLESAHLVRQIAIALQEAHDRGIVHRDLKPGNVMLTARGVPVVMDFGLAKRVADADADAKEAKLTQDGAVLGTPSYMAPEQVRGEVARIGPHTDVYALGVMLFQMLTGRTPYRGAVGAVMGQILGANVPRVTESRPDADPVLDAICQRAMAKEIGDRYASMTEFATALDEYMRGTTESFDPFADLSEPSQSIAPEPSVVRTATRVDEHPTRKPRRRWPQLVGTVVAGLLVLVCGALLIVKTKYGEVVIELSEPSANVEVAVDGERIDLVADGKTYKLKVGEHGLTVTGDGFESESTKFTVQNGLKETVRVTLRPKLGISPVPLKIDVPTDTDTTFLLQFEGNLKSAAGKDPLSSKGITYVPGKVGQAARFAADGKVMFPVAGNLPTVAGTIEFWVRPDWDAATSPVRAFIEVGNFPNDTLGVGLDSFDSTIRLSTSGDNPSTPAKESDYFGTLPMGPVKWRAGEWHHVAATWDNAAHRRCVYLDGVLAQMDGNAPSLTRYSTATFAIGGTIGDDSRACLATLDEFRISKRAKTAAEITAAHAGAVSKPNPGDSKSKDDGQKAILDKLKAAPDDPAANLARGRYLVTQWEWITALPHLAKASDPIWQAAAQKEIAGLKDAATCRGMADDWWNLAEKLTGIERIALRMRAADWYVRGLEGCDPERFQTLLERIRLHGGAPNLSGALPVGSVDFAKCKTFEMTVQPLPDKSSSLTVAGVQHAALFTGLAIPSAAVIRARCHATGRQGDIWQIGLIGRDFDSYFHVFRGSDAFVFEKSVSRPVVARFTTPAHARSAFRAPGQFNEIIIVRLGARLEVFVNGVPTLTDVELPGGDQQYDLEVTTFRPEKVDTTTAVFGELEVFSGEEVESLINRRRRLLGLPPKMVAAGPAGAAGFGPLVFDHPLTTPDTLDKFYRADGQLGSKPTVEPGQGLRLNEVHTTPAVWARTHFGGRYRVSFETRSDHATQLGGWVLNGPGYGNSHRSGYWCDLSRDQFRMLREGKEVAQSPLPKLIGPSEWVTVLADVDGGKIEVSVNGTRVAAFTDPTPLAGPLHGWFGLRAHGSTYRNLKIWSATSVAAERLLIPPPGDVKPAANGELVYELKPVKGQPLADWWQSAPQLVAVASDGVVLGGPYAAAPIMVLTRPLRPELACEVEFEYTTDAAINLDLGLWFAAKPPRSGKECDGGWLVGLPRGFGDMSVIWHGGPKAGKDELGSYSPLLIESPYYVPVRGRRYVARLETHGDELRLFLDGRLLLSTRRPAEFAAPDTPCFLSLSQFYEQSKVYAVRVYQGTSAGTTKSGSSSTPKQPEPKKTPEEKKGTTPGESEAIAHLTKLSAIISRDNNLLGKPVAMVSLARTTVTDADLKELAAFKSLTALDLSFTKITDVGLKELASLKNLKTLDLQYTLVTGTGFKELTALDQLTTLNLTNTKVTDAGLKELAPFQKLTKLDMCFTKVTDTGLKELAVLKNLKELDIQGSTAVTDAGLKELAVLKNLKKLVLTDTKLADAGLKELCGLQDLTDLYLQHTKVTDAGLKALADLKNLRSLNLNIDTVTNLTLKELAPLTSLTELTLMSTQVTDIGLKELAPLKNLKKLALFNTKVTGTGLKDLAALKNLVELDLGATTLTDAGWQELANVKSLEKLSFYTVQVTDAGFASLASLPNLTTLDFTKGILTDAGLKQLVALKNLSSINLSYCVSWNTAVNKGAGLTVPVVKELANIKSLTSLNLTGSNVPVADVKELQMALPKCLIYR